MLTKKECPAIVRCLSIIFIVFVITGCQTSPSPVDIKQAAHGKSVGIWVSDLGTPMLVSIGFSVFSNIHGQAPLQEHQITKPALLDKQLADHLQQQGWNTVSLNILADTHASNEALENALLASRKQGLSYTLIITPSKSTDFISYTNGRLKGVGLYQHEAHATGYFTAAFASLNFSLYNSFTKQKIENEVVRYCSNRKGPIYDPHVDKVELIESDVVAISSMMREAAANGLWRIGLTDIDIKGNRYAAMCDVEMLKISKDMKPLAPPPPPELVARMGEEIGGISMSCSNPYKLERDCSILSGAKHGVIVSGKKLKVASNMAGTIILVMPDTGLIYTGSKSIWNPILALKDTAEHLQQNGVEILKINPVTTAGRFIGYVLELDHEGYGLL